MSLDYAELRDDTVALLQKWQLTDLSDSNSRRHQEGDPQLRPPRLGSDSDSDDSEDDEDAPPSNWALLRASGRPRMSDAELAAADRRLLAPAADVSAATPAAATAAAAGAAVRRAGGGRGGAALGLGGRVTAPTASSRAAVKQPLPSHEDARLAEAMQRLEVSGAFRSCTRCK
jgi:hypothetical protein